MNICENMSKLVAGCSLLQSGDCRLKKMQGIKCVYHVI